MITGMRTYGIHHKDDRAMRPTLYMSGNLRYSLDDHACIYDKEDTDEARNGVTGVVMVNWCSIGPINFSGRKLQSLKVIIKPCAFTSESTILVEPNPWLSEKHLTKMTGSRRVQTRNLPVFVISGPRRPSAFICAARNLALVEAIFKNTFQIYI